MKGGLTVVGAELKAILAMIDNILPGLQGDQDGPIREIFEEFGDETTDLLQPENVVSYVKMEAYVRSARDHMNNLPESQVLEIRPHVTKIESYIPGLKLDSIHRILRDIVILLLRIDPSKYDDNSVAHSFLVDFMTFRKQAIELQHSTNEELLKYATRLLDFKEEYEEGMRLAREDPGEHGALRDLTPEEEDYLSPIVDRLEEKGLGIERILSGE
jgi:hypothetical protein